jgi:nucleoid DNA-binding protein
MALTKDLIVDQLVERYDLRRREALDLIDTFFDDLKRELTANGKTRLPGFGLFTRKTQPYKLKRRDIPAEETPNWEVITFQAAPALTKRVQRALIEESRDVD